MAQRSRHHLAHHRAAAACGFFAQGLVFISLTAKMPEIQTKFGLSPSTFSLLMLGLVLAAGVGSFASEKFAVKHSSALVMRVGFAIAAVAMPLMAVAGSVAVLAAGMALYGLAVGMVDAGNNMQGVALEHRYGRPIMQNFYAAWTLGGIAGTLGALATHQISFETSALGLAVILVLLIGAPYLKMAPPVIPLGDEGTPVPWKRILPVGIAMVLFYMAEMAVTTWGPTYVDKVFHSSAALIAVATLPYLVASLGGRTIGDRLSVKLGAQRLVQAGAALGVIGLALVVFSPGVAVALLGFLILGLGISVVAPLSFSAAAAIGRDAAKAGGDEQAAVDAVIARFNQFNYVGAILGSVMTGAVGDSSLRYGFAIPMVLTLGLLPLARNFATGNAVRPSRNGGH